MLGIRLPIDSKSPFEEDVAKHEELWSWEEFQEKFENDWDSFADYAQDVNRANRTDNKGIAADRYGTWEDKLGDWSNQNQEFADVYPFTDADGTDIINKFQLDWTSFADIEDDFSAFITDYDDWERHMDVFYQGFANMKIHFVEYYTSWEDFLNDFISSAGSLWTTWSGYEDAVTNVLTGYDEFRNLFVAGSGLESSLDIQSTGGTGGAEQSVTPAAGVRIHEEDGITKDGGTADAGAIEIYGTEVHFSETGNVGTSDSPSLEYNDFSVSDEVPTVGNYVIFDVEVVNTSGNPGNIVITLKRDGTVVRSTTQFFQSHEVVNISFSYRSLDYGSWDFTIGNTAPITVSWIPGAFRL